MFSKGLLALHIEHQRRLTGSGNAKLKCQLDPPMNCGAKQIAKSPVWQYSA